MWGLGLGPGLEALNPRRIFDGKVLARSRSLRFCCSQQLFAGARPWPSQKIHALLLNPVKSEALSDFSEQGVGQRRVQESLLEPLLVGIL